MRPFAFDTPGAGFGQGRWNVPGLTVQDNGEVLFLDACLQQVLAAFVCAYPTHLGNIALGSFMDPGLPVLGLELPPGWIGAVTAWAAGRSEVAEVWLFGSRAKGTSRPDSDLDIGSVLIPSAPGHDWPLGNWFALHKAWQGELEASIGRHVSLEAFSRPDEEMDEREAKARVGAIKLWSRPHNLASP